MSDFEMTTSAKITEKAKINLTRCIHSKRETSLRLSTDAINSISIEANRVSPVFKENFPAPEKY